MRSLGVAGTRELGYGHDLRHILCTKAALGIRIPYPKGPCIQIDILWS